MYRNRFPRYMKRCLVLFGVLFIFYPNLVLAAERYAVTGEIANIRSGPGTKHEVLFQAEKYYPIILLEKKGNWYKIEDFEGDKGWIHKSLADKIQSVITIKPKCNVRSGPGINYQIAFICEKGVPFRVIERKGNWIHVRHADGYKGWMHKSLVW